MARKHERTSHLTEVTLESASGKYETRISDLSLGGCFVDTRMNAVEGEDITVRINVVDGEQLRIKGKVAYVMENFGLGISFTDIDDETREKLERVLSKL